MGGEEKRHQMMQNLFGDESDEEDELESNPQLHSDEGEGEVGQNGEGEEEGEGEVEIESEGEREQISHEIEEEVGDQREQERGARDSDSDAKDDYSQRVVTSRRRDVVESGSEENHFNENDGEEVDAARSLSGSPRDENDQTRDLHSAPEIRDVFGDFDDEEEDMGYAAQQDIGQDSNRYPADAEGSYGKSLRPEDILADEGHQYELEEENIEMKTKDKPLGPPLELEIPLREPPALPNKMNLIKVSNIMGIDPKPFDPKTYEEEDTFVTDELGNKKRIRLENNIVRWREVKNPDGTTSVESNARFVRWSDGSLQLLIGNEVLDISEQDAQHDQSHLFLRHGKGILQSQGRLLQKMRFMPSSLSSNSHRLLTAIVDSRQRKVYKVKNCVTDIDPEKEKEEKEKAESQTIRASELLSRKRDKVNKKYTPTDRRPQLSPGFLEDALDEDDEADYYDPRHKQRHFEDELEAEVRAEKRIMNAKKSQGPKNIPRKSSIPPAKSSRNPLGYPYEREESEYETDEDEEEEIPHSRTRDDDTEPEYEDSEEDDEETAQADSAASEEEEEEEPKHKSRDLKGKVKRKGFESEEHSLPRKPTNRRMTIVSDSDDE
ncbi:protein LEO1 homolog [Vicia villosa]|uniref:protein LEO1 homolog n=1 Tax=Vicia villosa TaxID=3911 RepID=UPI00273B1E40|nr:protein LEO1 homolog [Vicia villosa]